MTKTAKHQSLGSMPKGQGATGKFGKPDHCSFGEMPGEQTAPNNPRKNASGKPARYEGGNSTPYTLPEEKDYSGYSRGK